MNKRSLKTILTSRVGGRLHRRIWLAIAACMVVLAVGCGADDTDTAATSAAPATEAASPTTTTAVPTTTVPAPPAAIPDADVAANSDSDAAVESSSTSDTTTIPVTTTTTTTTTTSPPVTTTTVPVTTTTVAEPEPEWVRVEAPENCICADGSEFSYWVREADPTKVVLYLEGGGACFSAETCSFTGGTYSPSTGPEDNPIYAAGILNFDHPANPLADYSFVAVPSRRPASRSRRGGRNCTSLAAYCICEALKGRRSQSERVSDFGSSTSQNLATRSR